MFHQSQTPSETFRRAEEAVRSGKLEEAITKFLDVAQSAPEDSASLTRAGHLFLRLNQPMSASGVLVQALARNPANATAWFLKGEAAVALGRDNDAARAFRRVVALTPYAVIAHAALGVAQRRLARWYEAADSFKEAARLEPQTPERQEALGLTAFEAGMMEDASVAFMRQALLDPGNAVAMLNLGTATNLVGQRGCALNCCMRATYLNPTLADPLARAARYAARLGMSNRAWALDRRAIPLDPAILECWRRWADRAEAAKDWPRAVALNQRALVLEPERESIALALARSLVELGRAADAVCFLVAWHGKAVMSDPAFDILFRAATAAGVSVPSGVRTRYQDWINRFEPRKGCSTIVSMEAPSISVIMAVCDPRPELFEQTIASVRCQDFLNWQLCIADNGSRNPIVTLILNELAEDPNISVARCEERRPISAATNMSLAMATEEIVTFLDHEDILAPNALSHVARAFCDHPDVEMVYSDEDNIDPSGRRFDPNFKPDWNVDLLLSQNYVAHLMAIRRSRVETVGGVTPDLVGCQHHDLALRVSETVDPDQILHIPSVLYHQRAVPSSTALAKTGKVCDVDAIRDVLQGHHDRTSTGARVKAVLASCYTTWPVPNPAPKVSVIVLTRDRLGLLRRCVDSLMGITDYPSVELIIVDNGSAKPTTIDYLASLESEGRANVLRAPGPFNFSALNNLAARVSTGGLVCLLNNDVEIVEPDWLREMVSHALRPGVGIVGAKLLYSDETVQHGGVFLWGEYCARHIHVGLPRNAAGSYGRALSVQTLSAVTGACMVMRREIYRAVNGLDEDFAVDFNDIDLCMRVGAAGYRTVWTPHAVLLHHESASRGSFMTRRKAKRYHREAALMRERWGDHLSCDPAYNPNLSLDPRDKPFELSFPPRRNI